MKNEIELEMEFKGRKFIVAFTNTMTIGEVEIEQKFVMDCMELAYDWGRTDEQYEMIEFKDALDEK